MPLEITVTIGGAQYTEGTKRILVHHCANLGANQYSASDVQYSLTGTGIWTSVDTIITWQDDQAEGELNTALSSGTYDVRCISSDNVASNTVTGAFTIAGVGNVAILYEKIYTF